MVEPSRAEHLAWCKNRALEYVDRGDLEQAYASMCSDLGKHPATESHVGQQLGLLMLMGGKLDDAHEMRRFIEGFN